MATVSGIVLAGGESRRLGRDKAVEVVGGQYLITRVIDRMREVCSDVLVVVSNVSRYPERTIPTDVETVLDKYPGKGCLGGIYSGLTSSKMEFGLVVACDMPFLNLTLLKKIIDMGITSDICVPVLSNRPEPTHAMYSRNCLPYMKNQLDTDDLKITNFFSKVTVNYIDEDVVKTIDPDLLSFFNINYQSDLDRALSIIKEDQ